MATEEDKQFYKEHRHEPYQQLRRAMETRDLRKIRYLIRTGKVDPNVRLCSFMSRKSLLHIFISDFNEFSLSQRRELIRLMVARGADIHVKNDDGNSIYRPEDILMKTKGLLDLHHLYLFLNFY